MATGTLTSTTIAARYKSLLKLTGTANDVLAADASAKYVEDGDGNDSVLSLSTTRIGIGNTAPDSLLEIQQGSSGGLVAFKVDNDDTDKVAVSIEAANIDADVMDISADAVTTANVIDITADALTTGSAAIFDTTSTALASTATGGLVEISSTGDTDTNINNLLYIVNDHADSAGTTALKIKQDSTGSAIDVGGGYMANEQGRQDHVANTMSAPSYRFDGVDDSMLNTPGTWPIAGYPLSLMVSFRTESTGGTALCGLYPSGSALYQIAIAINEGSAGNISLRSRNETNLVEHSTSAIYNDGKWHTAVGVWVSSTQRHLYIDGELDVTHTGTGSYYASLDRIAAGHEADSSPGGYYEGEISKYQVFNYALSATEVKALYSGVSVPFKHKGAAGERITATNNRDFSSDSIGQWVFNGTSGGACAFDGSVASGAKVGKVTSATDSGSKTARAHLPTAANSPLLAGKTYKLTCRVWLVGTFTAVKITTADVSPDATTIVTQATVGTTGSWQNLETIVDVGSDVTGSIEIDADSGTTGAQIFYFDNVSVTHIGAVAEYDGSGVGKARWDDKSGNDFHGTVSGATVENAPADADSGLTYEEGTWTGVFSNGTNPCTMDGSNTTGFYTKVGNLVHVSGYFSSTSLGSATSGNLRMTGLPFTVNSSGSAYSGGGVAYGAGLAITAGHSVSYHPALNNTYINFTVWDATTGSTDMQMGELTADGKTIIGFSYRVA